MLSVASSGGVVASLLPDLPGVRPLTRNEIKKDIGLIESCYDSDSDASVSSSEAISSTYPVKPRNYTKLPRRDEMLLQSRVVPQSRIDVGGGMSMDDAIEFLKAVESARPEVYEGEKERENLEIRYQAIREMCLSQSESFLTKKRDQKNYIRLVQGICRIRCQYYDTLCQKNSLLYDLILSLQSKKSNLNLFTECRRSLEAVSDKDHQPNNENKPEAVLHIYRGQCVSTPMGDGIILDINVADEKVTLQLPFGTLHSALSSVVNWALPVTSSLDINHADNLSKRWHKILATPSAEVGMTQQRHFQIGSFLAVAGESSQQRVAVVEEQPSSAKASRKTQRSSSRIKESQPSVPNIPATVDGGEAESVNSTGKSIKSETSQISDSKRNMYLNHTKKLPLLFCPPGIAPYLVSNYSGDYNTENSNAKTLPVFSKHGDKFNAEYCYKAFQSAGTDSFFSDSDAENDENCDHINEDFVDEEKIGCRRLDDYAQRVASLKDDLRPILQKIKECRKRKRALAKQVEITKLTTSNISQKISKIRLGMFTRRVLYRQNILLQAEREKAGIDCNGRSKNSSSSVVDSKVAAKNVVVPETQSESTRRKSTRNSTVVAVSSSDVLPASRTKRKKEDTSKEEDSLEESTSVTSASNSNVAAKSSNSQNSSSSTSKRNSKRLRR